ncbi:MAG: ThuA domain-containing protein, partial [Planctomycetota bacterium]
MKLIACFTLTLALGSPAILSQEEKTILLIGHKPDHPPKCHEYLSTCELLAKCLRQTKGLEAVVSNGWPADEKLLQRTDSIVLYTSPGAEIVLAEKSAAAFEAMMKRGVGLVAIHWATGVHKKNVEQLGKRWYSSLGGGWPHFAGITMGKSPLVQKNPGHPVCRGWKQYEISDEFYFSPVIHEKGKVLLEV